MQELRGKELQAEVFQAKSEKRLGDPADFEAGANGGRSHWWFQWAFFMGFYGDCDFLVILMGFYGECDFLVILMGF